MTKATNTHSENVIFIACLGQKWLRERPSVTLDADPNRNVTSVRIILHGLMTYYSFQVTKSVNFKVGHPRCVYSIQNHKTY
jgi:hypothetical protein